MNIQTLGWSPTKTSAEPSPLLRHLTGDFAPALAALWPAPHEAILTAPAARRHLVCLWLDRGCAGVERNLILALPVRRLLPRILVAPPAGLAPVLAKLGEVAWSAADYSLLLDRLAEPEAAKVLRHAEGITPAQVRRLSLLPPALVAARVGRLALDEDRAVLIGDAFAAIRQAQGEAAAEEAAARWGQARSIKALFQAAKADIEGPVPPPPYPGSERLRPLATKQALHEAAARFRNCLGDMVPYASEGASAYYEWPGPPAVAVEITRDRIFGWRLAQAKLARNHAVPAVVRDEIVAELRDWGVHCGRSAWDLSGSLHRARSARYNLERVDAWLEEVFD